MNFERCLAPIAANTSFKIGIGTVLTTKTILSCSIFVRDTLDFALSMLFGLIVMYDAQGIRRYAGETAIKVNELEKRIDDLSGDHKEIIHERKEKKLKESLGHQPEEVMAGSILGFLIGYISYLKSKK